MPLIVHRFTIWIDTGLKTISLYFTAHHLITMIFRLLHRQRHHKLSFQILGISQMQEFFIETSQALRNSPNSFSSVLNETELKSL